MFPQSLGNTKNWSGESSSQLFSDKLSERLNLRECLNCAGMVVGRMVGLLGVAVGTSSVLLLFVMLSSSLYAYSSHNKSVGSSSLST
jgi:hypothetical protein